MLKEWSCFDFVIVGAGIIGLSIAKTLTEYNSRLKIAVIEKEHRIGLHASGRNSGVLHSGIYYEKGSLKARFCHDGAKAMAALCDEYHLPIERVGKIILPVKPNDEKMLRILYQRAIDNGANVRLINAIELQKLEPEANAEFNLALYSPDTAVVDSKAILAHLYHSLVQSGVQFYFNHPCAKVDTKKRTLIVGDEKITYGYLFNTAGLYADKIAEACGLNKRYSMLPFKGIYYKLNKTSKIKIKHLLYPVPDMNVPFLGVHSTSGIDGTIYLGPTAIPAFGRENYSGVKGVRVSELSDILINLCRQYFYNKQGFRFYAHSEMPRLMKHRFVAAVKALIPRMEMDDLISSSKVGIRAQLVDKEKHELVMDFLVSKTANETHVLNAVSPAFTSAFSFSKFIVNSQL